MKKISSLALMAFTLATLKVSAQCPVEITPGGPVEICSGLSTVLAATSGPGYSYQWYRNNVVLPAAVSDTFVTSTHGFYKCIISAPGCTDTSNTVEVVVINTVSPTMTSSTPLTFCPPGSVTLNANNDPGVSYQWEINSTPIPGATFSSYTATSPGLYRALETVGSCSKYTPKIAVALATSVEVSVVSDAFSLPCNGAGVNFNVTDPIPGYNYQWQLDGADITGATTPSYIGTTAGLYTCVVNASCGTDTSNGIKISDAQLEGSITPGGISEICSGTSITLSATQVTGNTYEWYRNNVLLPGITTDTFTTSTHGFYYCIIANGICSVTSNTVEVKVLNATTPTIGNDSPLSFCPPGYVVLYANQDPGLSYQWELNSVPIPGATSSTYTATQPGLYRALESMDGCSKYTPKKDVTLATSVSAAITSTGTVVSCAGPDVELTVTDAIPGYNYQWLLDGVPVTGATDITYATSVAGNYSCQVYASCGDAISNVILLTPGELVAEISPSGNVAICVGSSIVLTATAGAGYSYQWQENGVDIAGETASNFTASAPGIYSVTISAPCGLGTSAATTISYGTIVAAITPAGTSSVCAGISQTFIAGTGAGYAYQWYRNNLPINVTSSSYTTATSGTYKVVVTLNGTCSETSNAVVLSVQNNPTPVITASGPQTFCSGDSVSFTANNFAGVSYQWQKNSIDIIGETGQTFTALDAGTYRVKETYNGCFRFTSKKKVTVVSCREGNAISEVNGDEDYILNNINIFPNPFADRLNVQISSSASSQVEIQVLDMLGKMQYKQQIITNQVNAVNTELPAGIYMVTAVVDGQLKVVRVVKTK